ncbi:MAG: hypothetical protein V4490_06425 [Pseudomonadota bacterium]
MDRGMNAGIPAGFERFEQKCNHNASMQPTVVEGADRLFVLCGVTDAARFRIQVQEYLRLGDLEECYFMRTLKPLLPEEGTAPDHFRAALVARVDAMLLGVQPQWVKENICTVVESVVMPMPNIPRGDWMPRLLLRVGMTDRGWIISEVLSSTPTPSDAALGGRGGPSCR